MVTVSLYDRTTVPTIQSGRNTSSDSFTSVNTSTSWSGYIGTTETVPNGNTCYFTSYIRNNKGGGYNSSMEIYVDGVVWYSTVSATTSTQITQHIYKNTTGSSVEIKFRAKSNYSTSGATATCFMYNYTQLSDADIAKWEVVNLPTTRHRKYAVDKYYMILKWGNTSFNIDGYSATTSEIVEVPVETIVSSTELTGSGQVLFQVTGKGFSATN